MGDTHVAASASYADVAAAIASATAGDTVTVPAGSATWATNLAVTKALSIVGAGIGSTIITGNFINDYPSGAEYFDKNNYLVSYEPADPEADETFRLSGFTLDCDLKSNGIYLLNDTYVNPIHNVRIDHVKVIDQYPGHYPFAIYGAVFGVMDHCELSNTRTWGCNDGDFWNNLRFDFGSANNFYFEDNTFTLGAVRTLGYGEGSGRYVFRHNTITLTADMYPIWDAHGNTSGWRSTMGGEIYDNTIDADGNEFNMTDLRGGKWMVYGNTVTNNVGSMAIGVREETQDSSDPPAVNAITGQPQHLSSTYIWSNSYGGTQMLVSVISTLVCGTCGVTVPVENVHFWQYKAAFDGTVGVGVGLKAARPATCTTGVGYWATDEEVLYVATATNTWGTYYTPYTYPHPLQGAAASTYRVYYDANGGSGSEPVDVTEYETSDEVSVAAQGSLSKYSYYAFMGWNTSSDGTGTTYQPGATMTMPASDVTLYAKWQCKGIVYK